MNGSQAAIDDRVTVVLDRDDVRILSQCVNEATNALGLPNSSERIGVRVGEARELLAELLDAYDSTEPT